MRSFMTKKIEDLIQDADQLIEEGQYQEAWNLLLPHQSNQSARIRLRWIRANQKQVKKLLKQLQMKLLQASSFHFN